MGKPWCEPRSEPRSKTVVETLAFPLLYPFILTLQRCQVRTHGNPRNPRLPERERGGPGPLEAPGLFWFARGLSCQRPGLPAAWPAGGLAPRGLLAWVHERVRENHFLFFLSAQLPTGRQQNFLYMHRTDMSFTSSGLIHKPMSFEGTRHRT